MYSLQFTELHNFEYIFIKLRFNLVTPGSPNPHITDIRLTHFTTCKNFKLVFETQSDFFLPSTPAAEMALA